MREDSASTVPGHVVIVIDDDLAVRNSLKFSLEIEGLTVRSYATGAELLSAGDPAYQPPQSLAARAGANSGCTDRRETPAGECLARQDS